MKKIKFFTILFVTLLLFNSCKKDSDKNFDINEFYGIYTYSYTLSLGSFTSDYDAIISEGNNDNEIRINNSSVTSPMFAGCSQSSSSIGGLIFSTNGNKISANETGIDATGEYNTETNVITIDVNYYDNNNCNVKVKYTLTRQ